MQFTEYTLILQNSVLEDRAPKLLVERTSSDRSGYRVIFREETDYNTLIRVNSLSEYPNFGGKVENLAYIG